MRVFLPLAGLLIFLMPSAFAADVLSLPEAERLAIEHDAERHRLVSQAEAQAERAIAAGSLPDPELRLGVANLPVDSFSLDAEAMTQLVVGLRQALPPGDTRDFRRLRGERLAEAMSAMVAERAANVRLALRETWVAIASAEAARDEIEKVAKKIAPLSAAAESRYATGAGRQGNYLAARLRLDRFQERALDASERMVASRAQLERWDVSAPATLALDALPEPASLTELLDRSSSHPLLELAEARIAANDAAVSIAEEAFGPQWGLDFSYGDRRGVDMFGVDRPDFVSAMVTVSLPLFTGDRQDRELAAAKSELRAAEYAREDVLRELRARLEAAWFRHRDVTRQLQLIDTELLPAATQAREATLEAYADNAAAFVDIADVETDYLEIVLRRLELKKRQQQLRAELRYLAGEPQ